MIKTKNRTPTITRKTLTWLVGRLPAGVLPGVGLVLVLLAACSGAPSEPITVDAGSGSSGADATSSVPVLNDLDSLEKFIAVFNEDAGTPRLLLLVSPT